MADKHDRDVEYDLEEEFEDSEEFEDLPSEHEPDMSDDEFDDQGLDDYEHYPDYIEIEEEPLHARASTLLRPTDRALLRPTARAPCCSPTS